MKLRLSCICALSVSQKYMAILGSVLIVFLKNLAMSQEYLWFVMTDLVVFIVAFIHM